MGVCLASLDAKLLERGVATTPGSVRPLSTAIAVVRKVPVGRLERAFLERFHVESGIDLGWGEIMVGTPQIKPHSSDILDDWTGAAYGAFILSIGTTVEKRFVRIHSLTYVCCPPVACTSQVPAFTGQCLSGAYCHVSLGHTTAMATATFFGAYELKNEPLALFEDATNGNKTALALKDDASRGQQLPLDDVASLPFPWDAAFVQQAHLVDRASSVAGGDDSQGCDGSGDEFGALQYCHFAFHSPVIAPPSSVVLGSRLDSTLSPASKAPAACSHDGPGKEVAALEHCRIAFHGRLVLQASDVDGGARKGPGDVAPTLEFGTQAGQVKLFTEKFKTGVVFRVGADGHAGEMVEVIGKDLLKKETNMAPFMGMILLTQVCEAQQVPPACVPYLSKNHVLTSKQDPPPTLFGEAGG